MAEEEIKRRPPISQLSKTPSWVMLGFVLGALFVSALPRHEAPAPRPIMVAPERSAEREPPLLTTVEAVFSEWSDYAIWENDTTQIALWNSAKGEFAEFYEVRRTDDGFYFRSITQLTHPLVRHGKPLPSECPLRFTESAEHYRQWLGQGRAEPRTKRSETTYNPPFTPPMPVLPANTPTVPPPTLYMEKVPIETPKIDGPKNEHPR